MEDPTISVGIEFAKFVEEHIEADADVDSITMKKEFTEFKKSVQDGRLKSASSPSYFIMTINMNSPESGVTEKRRRLVTILMRSFFSSIVFCQELPGCWDEKVVAECGTSGYGYVKNENESAVLWRKEDFDGETKGFETSNSWIRKVKDRVAPNGSQLLSKIAMVKLTPKTSSEESILAVSWHGPYVVKDDVKSAEFNSLTTFLAEVIQEKGIPSYIIGGDFNLNTLGIELSSNVGVPGYELSPRQTQRQKSSKYIPFKDNFVFYPSMKLRVRHVRPFVFEDRETPNSDLTKEDQKKVEEEMTNTTDTPVDSTKMLDHDPIIGVLQFTSLSSSSTAVRNLSNDFEQAAIADSE